MNGLYLGRSKKSNLRSILYSCVKGGGTNLVKKPGKIAAFIVVIAMVLGVYFPRSLVPHWENYRIISILYRADDWEDVRWFYPSLETWTGTEKH